MFPWLAPYTPWNGGMLAHCDYVTLDEAARFASGHAGVEITTTDFLRAAGRGQIQMLAACDRVVTWEPCHVTSVPTTTDKKMLFRLPIEACKALSQTGSANWRTIESYEHVKTFGDVLCRFTCWQLPDTEPDLKTTSDECRLTGYEVHSLSDAFIKEPRPTPAQTATMPAPVVTETASDSDEVKSGLQWWQESYNIPELWQNIGARLYSQKKSPSNTAIAKEIEKRINEIQKNKGLDRVSPNWDTIRGKLSGCRWKTD